FVEVEAVEVPEKEMRALEREIRVRIIQAERAAGIGERRGLRQMRDELETERRDARVFHGGLQADARIGRRGWRRALRWGWRLLRVNPDKERRDQDAPAQRQSHAMRTE